MYAPMHGRNLQRQVNALPQIGFPGTVIQNIYSNVYKFPGSNNFQSAVVTIGAIAANTDYVLSVNDITVTRNSAAENLATFTTNFLADIQAASNVSSIYVATSTGAGNITLTHRVSGMNETVAITGGAAAVVTTASTTNDPLPFGRVLVTVPGATPTDDLMPIQLPSAAGQNVVGIGGSFEVAEHRLQMPNGSQGYGVWPDNEITAFANAVMIVEAEVDGIAAETPLFFRSAANGALDKLGAVAPAAGAGLEQQAGLVLKSKRPSFTTSDGRVGVEVYIQTA